MKTKQLFAVIALAISLFTLGCSKDDDGDTLNNNKEGQLTMVNYSSNPYALYINNQQKSDIAGNGNATYNLEAGEYEVRVLQKSGYTLYPTDETYNITITAGNIYTKNFPMASGGIGGGDSGGGTGKLKLISTSSNPYEIYIDNVKKANIQGNGTAVYDLTTGIHKVRVLQISGYVLYPTDKTFNVDITKDNTSILQFP